MVYYGFIFIGITLLPITVRRGNHLSDGSQHDIEPAGQNHRRSSKWHIDFREFQRPELSG